jgi:hypothetical protein
MLVPVVVVVLLIGAGVPLYNRWRKRKLLEQTRGQNLCFTKEAKSDPATSDRTEGRKAAWADRLAATAAMANRLEI